MKENKANIRVLWFTNTEVNPHTITTGLNDGSRGWLSTLAGLVFDEVDLHIASIDHRRGSRVSEYFTNHYLRPRYRKFRLLMKWSLGSWDTEGDLSIEMQKLVEELRPDIVHIHGSEKQFIAILPYLNARNIPVLVSLQGLMSVIAKKLVAAYSERFLSRFFFTWGMSKTSLFPRRLHADYLEALSKAVREERFLTEAPYFAGRTYWDRSISTLFNPKATYFHIDRVLKPVFYEACWSLDSVEQQVYTIHTTLSNSAYKGFDVIAEAAYLLEKYGFTFQWNVAGIDNRSWSVRAAKRKLRSRYPKASLTLLGKVDAKQLVEHMLRSHQYVSASYIENSPNNLAEAMLLGMPCIATDVGGTSSYLDNNHTGRLIPPGDPYALAGCVRLLAADPTTRQKLGKHAREVSQRRHATDRIKPSLIAAYRTMIADYRRTQTRESGVEK